MDVIPPCTRWRAGGRPAKSTQHTLLRLLLLLLLLLAP
jgi:hypothetical protein